jgi:hypothetical protein
MALKRKLTPEEKLQIFSLHQQGLSGPEIADQMHIDDPRQVVGVIRAAVNFRKIPTMKPGPYPPGEPSMPTPPPDPRVPEAQAPAPVMPTEPPVPMHVPAAPPVPAPMPAPAMPAPQPVRMAAPAPVARPVQAPQAPAPAAPAPVDGFGGGWTQSQGYVSGFNYNAPTRKYMVYRDEPRNDGLLGEHVDPFTEQDLAKTYGQGVYRVLRHDPGNPRPFQTTVRVSANYGEPRFGSRAAAPERPGYGRWNGSRPWFRGGAEAPREEEGVNEPVYERPRSVYDFARNSSASGSGDATAAAIKALGDLNSKALDQVEQARRQGPDTFISKFFTEQQEAQRKQIEDQRRLDEQRRKDDEEKWERRQKEADREYQRRQEEEQKRHEREVEKLRLEAEARDKARDAERKMLMDLEDKRLQVIRDEHKMRQEALQEELRRNREEQRLREERLEKQLSEMQQATVSQIQEHQEKLEKELAREREQLEREQKLKEKHLDKEHELQSKILDVKQQQLESQGTNEVFTVVNNLINKFSSGLKEVVDLKKIEAMAPEAQAAAVQKGTINMGSKEKEEPMAEAPKPAAGAASSSKSAGGNGEAAPVEAAQEEERPMEEIVQTMVEQPFFKKVLKEWALHVRTKQDATTFVNMYLEWMRDPQDHEGRKATTMFANFIAPRPWAELYKIIKPKLDPEIVKVFDTADAEEYYETFRSLVTEQIAAYWEQFAQEREAVKAARRAALRSADAKVEEPAKK